MICQSPSYSSRRVGRSGGDSASMETAHLDPKLPEQSTPLLQREVSEDCIHVCPMSWSVEG